MEYEINHTASGPSSCLPKDMDSGQLIDVTTMSDGWRVFLDLETGECHDGAKYYQKYLDQLSEA